MFAILTMLVMTFLPICSTENDQYCYWEPTEPGAPIVAVLNGYVTVIGD